MSDLLGPWGGGHSQKREEERAGCAKTQTEVEALRERAETQEIRNIRCKSWQERSIMIREWFLAHEAYYSIFERETPIQNGRPILRVAHNPIEHLLWSRPKSSTYRIQYLFWNNALFVSGDVGSAVYQWPGSIQQMEWIVECDFHYFASKCQASEDGPGFRAWDRDYAVDHLQAIMDAKWFMLKDKSSVEGVVTDALRDRDEWVQWLAFHRVDFFGYEFADLDLGNIGMRIALRCQAHLVGLQMAFNQLKNKEKAAAE
jgi:hypothetical protein